MNIYRVILISIIILFLHGCTDYFENNQYVAYPPAYPYDPLVKPNKSGSIYHRESNISLYRDRIAHQVGDIITVRLEEQTQGQKKIKTKTDKSATNNFVVNKAFGANLTNGLGLDTSTSQAFDGNGESNQQNALNGTISATVTRVLSNGNLMIQGESWVTINFGREYIQLTGIIRHDDIEPDNTISSQRVTNARIVYSGNGQVSNATRGGILTQFFNKYWPY